jgi:hydrogenase expression/formation protein HypC
MCLGEVVQVVTTLPDRMVETTGPTGAPGARRVSLLALAGPVAPGDWLLVHSGFALERLTETEARAALALRSGAADPDPTRETAVVAADTPTGGPT